MLALLLSLAMHAPSGEGNPPAYKLEVREARRIEAVQTFDIRTYTMSAAEWVLVVARAPELPCQIHMSTRLEPAGATSSEQSPLHRPILTARVPARGSAREKGLTVHVTYRGTLQSRRLVPLTPDEPAPAVPPLAADERRIFAAASRTIDFRSKIFQTWLDENGLRPSGGERDIDFARRAFLAVKNGFRYQWPPDHDGKASSVCRAGRGDCASLCVVFVAALRASGVPARALVGHWARSLRPDHRNGEAPETHVKAEFFAEGIGWVPVDPTAAQNDRSPAGLSFFGNDPGDFLVQHVDYDLLVNTIHFGQQPVRHLQGIARWAFGAGSWDGLDARENWKVRTLAIAQAGR